MSSEESAAMVAASSSMSEGSMSGSSPWIFTMWVASGTARTASAIRSVPVGWSGEVITAFPPKAMTASWMRLSSVATRISSSRAHCWQRSQTCWINGFPAMRWRGFPGKRVEPQRDGRTPRMNVLGWEWGTPAEGWASVGHGITDGQERFRKILRRDRGRSQMDRQCFPWSQFWGFHRPWFPIRKRPMAKGYELHQARMMALQGIGKDLARRAKSKCELTGASGVPLRPYEVPPVGEHPDLDRTLLISEECQQALDHPSKMAGR